MQQNLDRTQLVPDDGADVPREMGWDDDKQVCIQPIALFMQSVPVLFEWPVKLPALPSLCQVFCFFVVIQFLQQIGKLSLVYVLYTIAIKQVLTVGCLLHNDEVVKIKADDMHLLLTLLASWFASC